MTLPNKLTLFRVLLIPAMVIIHYISGLEKEIYDGFNVGSLIIVLIFAIASLTDFFDGYLARKYNLITTFGKFMDPLADKLLVMAALLILMDLNLTPLWIIVIILGREFIVSGIRLVAVGEGKVIAASNIAKYKTATTMFAIIFLFLKLPLINDILIGEVLMYIALALTVISLVDYFWKNKNIILKSM